jgi:hypothetical protein
VTEYKLTTQIISIILENWHYFSHATFPEIPSFKWLVRTPFRP